MDTIAPTAPAKTRERGAVTSEAGPDREARRRAAAILEVLAGLRTPTEAAEALSISRPHYYVLEARAVAGLVGACAVHRGGPGPSAAAEAARLRQEVARLEREVQRQQALARAAQRAVGLAALAAPKPSRSGRRRPKPVARALRAAAHLRTGTPDETAPPAGAPV